MPNPPANTEMPLHSWCLGKGPWPQAGRIITVVGPGPELHFHNGETTESHHLANILKYFKILLEDNIYRHKA